MCSYISGLEIFSNFKCFFLTHIFWCLIGTSHLTSLKSKFVISPSPEMFLSQSSLSQQMAIPSLRQNHPWLFAFITTHMQLTTDSSSKYTRVWVILTISSLAPCLKSSFFTWIFTITSLLVSLILPSPISKTSPIVYSQHRRQSCPFKIQAGSHPSFTLTSVVFPHLTQSKSQTYTVAYRGPNELTHLHPHSCHLLQLSPFHSNFGHTMVLDVSCTCQEYSHLGIFYCATSSASDSFPTHNIWLRFSVYPAFWLCVI